MAPISDNDEIEGLAQAKKVLGAIMRLKTSKLLFNEPVDPAALGLDDYFDKVTTPMDFGTIMARLQIAEKSGWTENFYQTPSVVLRDINLVFQNCFVYNDGEGDAVTRELCAEVKSSFTKRWTEAGLSLELAQENSKSPSPAAKTGSIKWISEAETPAELSYTQGNDWRCIFMIYLPKFVLRTWKIAGG
jgi:hypothetical protein